MWEKESRAVVGTKGLAARMSYCDTPVEGSAAQHTFASCSCEAGEGDLRGGGGWPLERGRKEWN